MTKREKNIIKNIIEELLDDNGDFVYAVGRLCNLVGWSYPIAETKGKPCSVAEFYDRVKR